MQRFTSHIIGVEYDERVKYKLSQLFIGTMFFSGRRVANHAKQSVRVSGANAPQLTGYDYFLIVVVNLHEIIEAHTVPWN